jgi:hypothetical protein
MRITFMLGWAFSLVQKQAQDALTGPARRVLIGVSRDMASAQEGARAPTGDAAAASGASVPWRPARPWTSERPETHR